MTDPLTPPPFPLVAIAGETLDDLLVPIRSRVGHRGTPKTFCLWCGEDGELGRSIVHSERCPIRTGDFKAYLPRVAR